MPRRQRHRPRPRRPSSWLKQGCATIDCMVVSRAARVKRAGALLVAVMPTRQERPWRRWRILSAPVEGTGTPAIISGSGALLRDLPRGCSVTLAAVEAVAPLLAASAGEQAESWKVAHWREASTAWCTMGRMVRLCPRLPLSRPLAQASMEVAFGFSTSLGLARTLRHPWLVSEEVSLVRAAGEADFFLRQTAGQALPALQRFLLAAGSIPPLSCLPAPSGFLPSVTSSRS